MMGRCGTDFSTPSLQSCSLLELRGGRHLPHPVAVLFVEHGFAGTAAVVLLVPTHGVEHVAVAIHAIAEGRSQPFLASAF